MYISQNARAFSKNDTRKFNYQLEIKQLIDNYFSQSVIR